jgi:endonuclease/exonuclease/phosphatase family metal-dependent hydrolase
MEMLDEALAAHGKKALYEAFYFPAHAYQLGPKTHIYTTGLAILAHRDLEVSHHNSHVPADITHRHIHAVRKLKQTRICAHLRFKDRSGHAVDVFNTHLSLPTTLSRDFWTKEARMGYGPNQIEEAKNLIRFVEAERRSDRFFICGDFNSLPGSPVYQYLLSHQGYRERAAQLADGRFHAPSHAPRSHLHGSLAEVGRLRSNARFRRSHLYLPRSFRSHAAHRALSRLDVCAQAG